MKLNNTSATALTLSILLTSCAGQQPDAALACSSDSQCTGDSLCLSGSCEAAALHRHSTALSVAPAAASRTVPAGVKPADGWFSVVNNTVWGHYYAVACDSGATPRPAAGGVDWLDTVKITVDLLPPASGDSTVRCDVTSKSGKTIYGSFALTLHASGGAGDPDGGSSGDFTVATADASLSIAPGGSAQTVVSVAGTGSFASDVTLDVAGAPKGATATLDTATVKGGSGSATLTVAAGSAAAGTYPLTVTAVSGALSHTAALSVAIAAPVFPADFAIAASPGSLSLAQGTSGSSVISASPSNGFASDVALTLSGLPAGSKGSFDKGTIAGGSGSATLTISAGASAAVGSYTATVTATGGGLTHAATVALAVTAPVPPADFSLSAAPGSIAVQQGGASGASTLTLAALNGFARDVTLTLTGLPSGATGAFSAPTVFGGSGTSTLTVTGSGGTTTHTASLALSVAAPPAPADFFVSASPATLSLGPATNGTSSIAIAPVNGFTGSVTLSASGVPSGASAAFSSSAVAGSGTSTLTLSSGSAVAGTYTITVAGKSGSLSHSATISLTLSGPAQCTADTWANWAHGFFTTNCVGCHSKFDTWANVSSDQSNIQQYISSGVMPQGGSLSAADKTRILKWLGCSLPQ